MENIIDRNYFASGETYIPGINRLGNDNIDDLTQFITRHQKEFLFRVFGSELTDDKLRLLIPYIRDEVNFISPFANYIYCIYLESTASINTEVGVKSLSISNTTVEDWRKKAVAAWNSMVIMLQDVHNELYSVGTIGSINYVNDILNNLNVKVSYIQRANRSLGFLLSGGIFNTKTIYDYNK